MTDTYSPGVQQFIERGEALTAAEESHRAAMRAMKFDTIAVHNQGLKEERSKKVNF